MISYGDRIHVQFFRFWIQLQGFNCTKFNKPDDVKGWDSYENTQKFTLKLSTLNTHSKFCEVYSLLMELWNERKSYICTNFRYYLWRLCKKIKMHGRLYLKLKAYRFRTFSFNDNFLLKKSVPQFLNQSSVIKKVQKLTNNLISLSTFIMITSWNFKKKGLLK